MLIQGNQLLIFSEYSYPNDDYKFLRKMPKSDCEFEEQQVWWQSYAMQQVTRKPVTAEAE